MLHVRRFSHQPSTLPPRSVACQCFNLYACKTRMMALRAHGPWKNITSVGGVAAALFFAFFFIYIDGVQHTFATAPLRGYWFLFAPLYGILLCVAAAGERA